MYLVIYNAHAYTFSKTGIYWALYVVSNIGQNFYKENIQNLWLTSSWKSPIIVGSPLFLFKSHLTKPNYASFIFLLT